MMDGVNVIGWGLLTPSAVPDTGWKIAATPDFNKDGNFDLLWRHDNGWVSYWLMSADRVSSWSLIGHVPDTGWRIVATGDMNGDTWDDIIWQHQDGRVSYWYMVGPAWRGAQVVAALGDPGWRVVGATDIDRDGKTDLVWRHAVSGVTSVWFMNDRTALNASVLSFQVTDTNWQIVAFNDVNMDGNTDFIWRNTQDGRLSVWFMNGKTMVSGVSLNPDQVADTHWRIVGPR
jgi:hypothetical protein